MMKMICGVLIVWCLIIVPAGLYGDGFGITDVRPRIITPNADHLNDVFWVFYRNPMDSQVHGKIYDVDGAEVTDMVHKAGAAEYSLCWDGKDGSGSIVPAGAYIYQIKSENTTYNGIVIVAR